MLCNKVDVLKYIEEISVRFMFIEGMRCNCKIRCKGLISNII